jgi:lincosamide nucleotidyltransferase A/C/D/E
MQAPDSPTSNSSRLRQAVRKNAQALYSRASSSTRLRNLYGRAANSPVAPLLTRPVQRMTGRFQRRMGVDDVLEVLGALDASQVRYLVAGGWAADALLGEQTREHVDLDLVLDFADEGPACAALEEIGLRRTGSKSREFVRDALMPRRVFLRDDDGRMVDLHPVDLETWPGSWLESSQNLGIDPADAFSEGDIAGRPVPCLSAALQVASRDVYELSEADRQDVARLCAHFELTLPPDLDPRSRLSESRA